jgi:hypothetical protein
MKNVGICQNMREVLRKHADVKQSYSVLIINTQVREVGLKGVPILFYQSSNWEGRGGDFKIYQRSNTGDAKTKDGWLSWLSNSLLYRRSWFQWLDQHSGS